METAEYERMFRAESEHFWFAGTRAVIADALARALGAREGARVLRVLDVGCGTGYTLTRLPAAVSAVGLDASAEALRWAARRGTGARLVRAAAESLPVAQATFDAVLALDVLEHLDDDGAGAREIARVLRPGGVALVTAPAFGWLWSAHDEALHHRRRYRLAELRAVLRGAASRWSGRATTTSGSSRRRRVFFSRQRRGAAPATDLSIPSPGLNRAFTAQATAVAATRARSEAPSRASAPRRPGGARSCDSGRARGPRGARLTRWK
jgi:SAM-dependent methyltransferase